MIKKITPTGNLDQENDFPFVKDGDYRDALDVSSISDGNGNTISWEPKTQNAFSFDLGSIPSVQPAVWHVKFLGQSSGDTTLTFFRPNGSQITALTTTVLGDPDPTIMAGYFYSSVSSIPGVVAFLSPTPGIVIFQYQVTVPWDLIIKSSTEYVFPYKTQDPVDASMIGDFKLCGGKDLLGDLFLMSTTCDRMPEEYSIVSVSNSSGLIALTLNTVADIQPNYCVIVSGQPGIGSEWLVNSVSHNSTQTVITLAYSTYTPIASPTGKVTAYSKSMSKISVAVEDVDTQTTSITDLIVSRSLNFRLQHRVHLYCEDEKFRKSFYWCDGYNKDRVMYYLQDNYTYLGMSIQAGGTYALDTIDQLTRLQQPNIDIGFSFLGVNQGGFLKSGNYRYSIRLLNEFLTGTDWSDLSNIINIYSADKDNGKKIFGDADGTVTNKAVQFSLSNIPIIYKYYEIAYVRYSNNAYVVEAFRGDIKSSKFTLTHYGNETPVDINPDDLNIQSSSYDISHSIDALDGRLIRSNLISSDSIDFSDFFKTLTHTIRRLSLTSASNSLTSLFDNENPYTEGRDPYTVHYRKSFMPNETYRFSARVKLKDGQIIPQNFWIDDILVDENSSNAGNVFPNDNRRAGLGNFSYIEITDSDRNPYVYYVRFSNINWDYIINGKKISELVDRIFIDYVEINEENAEVLSSGMCIMSSNKEVSLNSGGNIKATYGKTSTESNWGPWVNYITSNTFPLSDSQRYRPAAPNTNFDSDQYWTKTNMQWSSSGYYYPISTASTSSIESQYPLGLFVGDDYKIMVYLNSFSSSAVIKATILGSPNQVFTLSNLSGSAHGTAGWYGIASNGFFTANNISTLKISIDPGYSVQISAALVYRNDFPSYSTTDGFNLFYNQYFNIDSTRGFFLSPDLYYNQNEISYLSGDRLIGVLPIQYNTFSKNNIGSSFSKCVYSEISYNFKNVLGYNGTSILSGGSMINPYETKTVNGVKLSNSTQLTVLSGTTGTTYYSLPKCFAFSCTQPVLNGFAIESGMTTAFYLRPKGRGAKYGSIKDSKYVYSGFSTNNTSSSTIDIYGDTFNQNTFVKLRTPFDKYFSSYGSNWGWGYGVGMYSFNRGNYQMGKIIDSSTGAPPDIVDYIWLEDNDILHTSYSNGYSNRFEIKTTNAFDPDIQVGTVFPTRICYSNVKENGSFADEYRRFLITNFRDLNLSNGEIVHHEAGNGELLTWQPKSFERQYFNSSGMISASNGIDVVIGDAGALKRRGTQISSIGTSHKWGISKGKSKGGNDVFAWVNTETGDFVRFGYDGTVPIAQVQNMMSSLRSKLKWANNKYTPSLDLGVRSIWDDKNKSFHFVIRGIRSTAGQYRSTIKYTGSDTYVYLYNGDIPTVYKLIAASAYNLSPPLNPSYWQEVTDSYNIFNIDYSTIKSGFQSYHSWAPKTMIQWKNTFVSSRPGYKENYIYIHDRGGTQYAYPGLGANQIQTNPYITTVCVNDPNMKTTYDAIELNSSLLPTQIDFTTTQHKSYLLTSDFEQDEVHDDLWSSPIKNDSTYDAVNNPTSVNDVDTSGLFGQYLLTKYSFNNSVKSKLFNFIIKMTPLSRLNNS